MTSKQQEHKALEQIRRKQIKVEWCENWIRALFARLARSNANGIYTEHFEELTDEDLPDKDSIINYPEPDAKEKFAALIGVSRKTIIYSVNQMPIDSKEWNTILGTNTLGSEVTFGVTQRVVGELKDDSHSGGHEKVAFYFSDLTAETKVLPAIYQDKQQHLIYSIDNPDSPIAA